MFLFCRFCFWESCFRNQKHTIVLGKRWTLIQKCSGGIFPSIFCSRKKQNKFNLKHVCGSKTFLFLPLKCLFRYISGVFLIVKFYVTIIHKRFSSLSLCCLCIHSAKEQRRCTKIIILMLWSSQSTLPIIIIKNAPKYLHDSQASWRREKSFNVGGKSFRRTFMYSLESY